MGKERWELWHDESADASFEIEDSRLKLYNGEFTAMASGNSLLEDRLRWISLMVAQCEERGIGWNYYDFGGEECFVFDTATGEWNEDIMGVLFPKQ